MAANVLLSQITLKMIKTIDPNMAIAERLTFEQLERLTQDEFKSILHLIISNGDIPDSEWQRTEDIALHCIADITSKKIRYKAEVITDEMFTEISNQIDKLPKPVLIHVNHALHALVFLLKYLIVQQEKMLNEANASAQKIKLLLRITL